MKQFLIRNEEKVFIFCVILLFVCILSAFVVCGFSKAIGQTAAKIYSIFLAAGMTFSALFPFVVMDLKK